LDRSIQMCRASVSDTTLKGLTTIVEMAVDAARSIDALRFNYSEVPRFDMGKHMSQLAPRLARIIAYGLLD
jgi:hypothetical protein